MKTTQDYLNGLEKVFTNPTCEDFETLEQDGYKLSLETKLDENGLHPDLPVQVLVRVYTTDGVTVSHWGCDSNESNAQVVTWWARKRAMATKVRFDQRSIEEKRAKQLFQELTK